MSKQRMLLVINPISGSINKDRLREIVPQRIIAMLSKDVDVKITEKSGDATKIAPFRIPLVTFKLFQLRC